MKNGHYVSIFRQHLKAYRYTSGGDMEGSYSLCHVRKTDDKHALITFERAAWHHDDPTVREYTVDASVLAQLERVIRRYRMNFWHRMNFTNIFISDGASYSYSFDFDKNSFNFSSQHYPRFYSSRLACLDAVIDRYIENVTPLPALVRADDGDEIRRGTDGAVTGYVNYYSSNRLSVRVFNGTDDEIEIPKCWELTNADTGEVLLSESSVRTFSVAGRSDNDFTVRLKAGLAAGNYRFAFGPLSVIFEIR